MGGNVLAVSRLPPPSRLAGPPPVTPPSYGHHPGTTVSPPVPPVPVQQVIIQPKSGVSAGQVVLIVIAVIVLAPFASCLVCTMAVGAGVNSASKPRVASPIAEIEAGSGPSATRSPGTPGVSAYSAPPPAVEPPSAAAVAAAPPAQPAVVTELSESPYTWKYDTFTDEMTGKVTRRAAALSETTHQLDFPYQGGTNSVLRLTQHPRNGLLVTVAISKGQLTCHSFTRCRILVRFDDRPPIKFRGTEPADHSSDLIFLEPEKQFLKELKNSQRVAVELPFFQGGNLVFHFNTAGLEWD